MYRPSDEVFDKVKKAVAKQEKEEKISLGKVHTDLNKEISFDEIKQVLIFMNRE